MSCAELQSFFSSSPLSTTLHNPRQIGAAVTSSGLADNTSDFFSNRRHELFISSCPSPVHFSNPFENGFKKDFLPTVSVVDNGDDDEDDEVGSDVDLSFASSMSLGDSSLHSMPNSPLSTRPALFFTNTSSSTDSSKSTTSSTSTDTTVSSLTSLFTASPNSSAPSSRSVSPINTTAPLKRRPSPISFAPSTSSMRGSIGQPPFPTRSGLERTVSAAPSLLFGSGSSFLKPAVAASSSSSLNKNNQQRRNQPYRRPPLTNLHSANDMNLISSDNDDSSSSSSSPNPQRFSPKPTLTRKKLGTRPSTSLLIPTTTSTHNNKPMLPSNQLGQRGPIRRAFSVCAPGAATQPDPASMMMNDEKSGKILHCERSREDGIMRVKADEVQKLISGTYASQIASYHIIDCRFLYEFDGGHIAGAVNINDEAQLDQLLLTPGTGISQSSQVLPSPSVSGQPDHAGEMKKTVLVFHCEFSMKRAPTFAKYLRSKDRTINSQHYPALYYPEVYILQGGYCEFFKLQPTSCVPQAYIPMDSVSHTALRSTQINSFRKFERTKSYSSAETTTTTTAFLSRTSAIPIVPASCLPLALAAGNVAQSGRGMGGRKPIPQTFMKMMMMNDDNDDDDDDDQEEEVMSGDDGITFGGELMVSCFQMLSTTLTEEDQKNLAVAVSEAKLGLSEGGIPIGAVIYHHPTQTILAQGHNKRCQMGSMIRHAEMDAFESLGRREGVIQLLSECTVYSTLSPCIMCTSTILLYRVPRVVISENASFVGGESTLLNPPAPFKPRILINAEDKDMESVMKQWIESAEGSKVWNEDIGLEKA